MKNVIVTLLLLLASCNVWAASPTIVELPDQYKTEQVQSVLQSIDYPQLAQEADKSVPGVLKEKVGFLFQPLIFHSLLGKPEHMSVRVDVYAPPNWGKELELKAFLAKELEKRFPGAKTTNTILFP